MKPGKVICAKFILPKFLDWHSGLHIELNQSQTVYSLINWILCNRNLSWISFNIIPDIEKNLYRHTGADVFGFDLGY